MVCVWTYKFHSDVTEQNTTTTKEKPRPAINYNCVVRTSHNPGPIRRQRHAVHRASARHLAQLVARGSVPDGHLVALIAAHNPGPIRRQRHAGHRIPALELVRRCGLFCFAAALSFERRIFEL